MKVEAATKKLAKSLSDSRRVRVYGVDQARKIALRLTALKGAASLADFWPPGTPPERCHLLTENFKGLFSMDLKHPYRLLFRPSGLAPDAEFESELQRWQAIQSIVIEGIEDTHE
jgi:proteic killer suppression protein